MTLPPKLVPYAEAHLRIVYGRGLAPTWEHASLGRVLPIRRPGIAGDAYYEIQVIGRDKTPSGYMVMSSGPHDFPIVEWSPLGITPIDRLRATLPEGGASIAGYYRHAPNIVAEDVSGQIIAGDLESMMRIEQRPRQVIGQRPGSPDDRRPRDAKQEAPTRDFGGSSGDSDANARYEMAYGPAFATWTMMKADYAQAYAPYLSALAAMAAPLWDVSTSAPIPFDDGSAPQCATDNPDTPHYAQVAGGSNLFMSGCGPTAWAILIGWEDRQAALGDPRFAPYWALYHENGVLGWFLPDEVAPQELTPPVFTCYWTGTTGPQATDLELASILGTTLGATAPGSMSMVNTYLQRQGFMADSIEAATFDWGGGTFDSLRDRAIKHICVDHVPAVIGIGALVHYAVASEVFGYWFWENMGHNGCRSRWDAPGVFFAGTILPKKQPVVAPGQYVAAGGIECLTINMMPDHGETVLARECSRLFMENKWIPMNDNTIRGGDEQCLDVDHSNTANGARIQAWDCNGTNAQHWTMPNFELLERTKGRCADVTGMIDVNGNPIQLWDCLGFWNQHWNLTAAGEIQNAHGRCLDVQGADRSNGARIDIADCDGSPAQKWAINPGGAIRGLGGKCLTASSTAQGAPLELRDCLTGLPNQRWSLHGAIQGLAGKCLDVTNGSSIALPTSEQPVHLWDCTGFENQKWTYLP